MCSVARTPGCSQRATSTTGATGASPPSAATHAPCSTYAPNLTPLAPRRRWFHCSLALWNASFGAGYPRLRWWWRVELDVAFAGSWGWLAERTESVSADVLLASVVPYENKSGVVYPHWQTNAHLLHGVPREEWTYALVSIGRYSGRFLGEMAARWARGAIGFEEVALPMTCYALGREACELGTFRRLRTKSRWRPTMIADFFRFRPVWECADFVGAASRHTHEIWHPLKERDCWVQYLDACDASGCHTAAPPLLSHCHDTAGGFLRTCEQDPRSGRARLVGWAGWNGTETCRDECQ